MAHATLSLPTTVKFCFGTTEQNIEMKLDNIASTDNKRRAWQNRKNNKSRTTKTFASRQARQRLMAIRSSSSARQGKLADRRNQIGANNFFSTQAAGSRAFLAAMNRRQQVEQKALSVTKSAGKRVQPAAMGVERLKNKNNDVGRRTFLFQRRPRYREQYQFPLDVSAQNFRIPMLKASQKTRSEKLVQQRRTFANAIPATSKGGSNWRSRTMEAEFNNSRQPPTLDARFASIRKERYSARNVPSRVSNQTSQRKYFP